MRGAVNLSSVVVASGSAGTHAGLAVGLEQLLPDVELIGVTVSAALRIRSRKWLRYSRRWQNNWS